MAALKDDTQQVCLLQLTIANTETWSGNSAKVFIVSFCACLCKLVHVHGEDDRFLYDEAIVQWYRTIEILINKLSKDWCTVKQTQNHILAHYINQLR